MVAWISLKTTTRCLKYLRIKGSNELKLCLSACRHTMQSFWRGFGKSTPEGMSESRNCLGSMQEYTYRVWVQCLHHDRHQFINTYLGNQKVHIIFDKYFTLLFEFCLACCFAFAAKVGGCLAYATSNEGIPFFGDFEGNITSCLVDRWTLEIEYMKNDTISGTFTSQNPQQAFKNCFLLLYKHKFKVNALLKAPKKYLGLIVTSNPICSCIECNFSLKKLTQTLSA